MPIIKSVTTDSGMPVAYHTPFRLEIFCNSDGGKLEVHSHVDEAAAAAKMPPVAAWYVSVDSKALAGLDMDSIESYLVSNSGFFAGGHITSDVALSLEAAKDRKRSQINQSRLTANRTVFSFKGKQIACDELSRSDIDATNGLVAITGAMPPGWVGGWKTVDNSYVAIPDITTWTQFYGSMVAQGLANFNKAQALKASVASAQTVDEIEAITW